MRTDLVLDRSDQTVIAYSEQDCDPILDRNQQLRSQPQKSDWGREIAEIPNVIIVKWLNEEWMRGNVSLRPFTPEFRELVARKLRDPEWKYLRTDK